MRQALLAIFFLAVAVGSAAFQSQMKAWPQVVAMVVAILPIIGHFMKQDLAFSRAWLLLLAIALFEALCAGAQSLWRLLAPDTGLLLVNGVPRKVMTYDWLWPILVSIAATAFIVFGYTKRSGRPRMLELAFASAMLIIWATLFLLHET